MRMAFGEQGSLPFSVRYAPRRQRCLHVLECDDFKLIHDDVNWATLR